MAILHSLANVEQWAIDTAWDTIARFHSISPSWWTWSSSPSSHLLLIPTQGDTMPFSFFHDFVRMAAEEAKVYMPSLLFSTLCVALSLVARTITTAGILFWSTSYPLQYLAFCTIHSHVSPYTHGLGTHGSRGKRIRCQSKYHSQLSCSRPGSCLSRYAHSYPPR